MRRGIAVPVLVVAALLVAWQGVIVSLPHSHADPKVPQKVVSCSASQSGAQTFHIHRTGSDAAAHACLACLARSTFAVTWNGVPFVDVGETVSDRTVDRGGCRAAFHAHLPGLRAPPCRFGA